MDISLREMQESFNKLKIQIIQTISDIEEQVRREIQDNQLLVFDAISGRIIAEWNKAISVERAERANRQANVAEQHRIETIAQARYHLDPIHRFLLEAKICKKSESLEDFIKRRYKIERERRQSERPASGPSIDEIVSSEFQDSDWKVAEFIIVGMENEKYQIQLIELITGIHIPAVKTGSNHRIDKTSYEFVKAKADLKVRTKDFDVELEGCPFGKAYFNLKFLTTDTGAIPEIRECIDAQIGAVICSSAPIRFFNILDGAICHRYANFIVNGHISFKSELNNTKIRIMVRQLREAGKARPNMTDEQLELEVFKSIFIGDMFEFKEKVNRDNVQFVSSAPQAACADNDAAQVNTVPLSASMLPQASEWEEHSRLYASRMPACFRDLPQIDAPEYEVYTSGGSAIRNYNPIHGICINDKTGIASSKLREGHDGNTVKTNYKVIYSKHINGANRDKLVELINADPPKKYVEDKSITVKCLEAWKRNMFDLLATIPR